MNLSAIFIRRPVATTLVMLAIALFGVLAYLRLPVSALPNVDFPTINVSAGLPGASAETMAASVATPLEREFSTIDGVDSMTSSNSLGSTQITLQFTPARNLDAAAQDVQAAISRALTRLPHELPAPPSYKKVNPADQPIVLLSLSSASLPLFEVNEFAETRLAQRISTIRGVAQVQVYGAQKYAVRIQVDPDALAQRGIGIDEVSQAIRSANVNTPTGTLFGADKAYTIQANGQLLNAKAFEPVIVSYKNGAPVRLADVARVSDSVENDKTAAWTTDQRSVVLAVQKQPGANTVAIVQSITNLLPDFERELPRAVRLEVLFDRSISVRDSVMDVQFTLLLTLALVVMVIFVFLRRVMATVIPSLAMPLAILGTFSGMYLLDYSLDNLSLMALTLSVGFVVDDAIVMLENVVRHMEMGKPPLQAALDGAREVSFTILSMTISLVAVFLPFLFMGGILGRLFREFAVTIAIAILVSGFVSLTLTPMLTARFMRPEAAHPARSGPGSYVEAFFDGLVGIYGRSLRVVLRHWALTGLFSIGVLAATVYLFQQIPKGFLPTEDAGQVQITTEAIEGISFEAVRERQLQVNEILRKNPDVEGFLSSVGPRGTLGSSNTGFAFLRLKPRDQRPDIQTVVARVRKDLQAVPGMRSFVTIPPQIRIGGTATKSDYQLSIQSADTNALYANIPGLLEHLSQLPMLRDVTSDLQIRNTLLKVEIDRDRAASLGVTTAAIEDALYAAFGNRQISTIYAPTNSYEVILEVLPTKQTPNDLQNLYVRSDSGALVPMRSLAKLTEGVGPLSINHAGQMPAVTVSFNLSPGYGLSQATGQVLEVAKQVLPADASFQFRGAAEAFGQSLSGLGLLLLVSIFVIYVVLGILYESFVHPVTILSALPFAGFGALATLTWFHVDLDVYAFVGIILLVGLVKKNGIMMIDFALEAQRQGASASAAIHEACVVRFRPIMMTTMAALLGTLPIALGLGAGAETRRPLGLAVVGGLLFSQLLTLYVTPVFFVYAERLRHFTFSRKARTSPEPAIAE
ncbi:MAG TPA: efflux RND transporter permease subunit [Polyangiaceae bacterium]|jgi:HAE1 family hydrophobic/amphiphilic exporter-1|nr:efflux RND transporter permease subunit [Polyangiaceae bacterium]